jgi:hypothetical protein
MELNFSTIQKYAKVAFENTINEDLYLIKKANSYHNELSKKNPLLGEMFINDFSYEWNKLQSKYFLKTGILINVESGIVNIPSVWVTTWGESAKKNVLDLSIDENFDLRKYPFEHSHKAINKLSLIFSHVFKSTEKDLTKAIDMKDDILGYYHLASNDKKKKAQINRIAFTHFIYNCAILDRFEKSIDTRIAKDIYTNILEYYYGKQNKENDSLFNIYERATKSSNKNLELNQFKLDNLSFRDQDSYYWKYFQRLNYSNTFLEQLGQTFDCTYKDTPSISNLVWTRNNHDIMQLEMPRNEESTKKTIKI